jgi:hypothetical protein
VNHAGCTRNSQSGGLISDRRSRSSISSGIGASPRIIGTQWPCGGAFMSICSHFGPPGPGYQPVRSYSATMSFRL